MSYYNNVIRKAELALAGSVTRKPRWRWNKCETCGLDVKEEFKTICKECNDE